MSIWDLCDFNETNVDLLRQHDVFDVRDFEKISLHELTDIVGSARDANVIKKNLSEVGIFLKDSDAQKQFNERMTSTRSRSTRAGQLPAHFVYQRGRFLL